MLMALDKWVIAKVSEPLMHAIERATGIGNFQVARFLLMIVAASDAVQMYQQPTKQIIWVSLLIDMTVIAMRLFAIAIAERSVAKAKFGNSEKHDFGWSYARVFVLIIAVPLCLFYAGAAYLLGDWSLILPLFWQVGLAGQYYAAACDPPAPQEQREPLFSKPAWGTN